MHIISESVLMLLPKRPKLSKSVHAIFPSLWSMLDETPACERWFIFTALDLWA